MRFLLFPPSPDETTQLALGTCRAVFTAPSTQNLLYNSSFDLVVMDAGLNDCALGLATLHYKSAFMAYNAACVPVLSISA